MYPFLWNAPLSSITAWCFYFCPHAGYFLLLLYSLFASKEKVRRDWLTRCRAFRYFAVLFHYQFQTTPTTRQDEALDYRHERDDYKQQRPNRQQEARQALRSANLRGKSRVSCRTQRERSGLRRYLGRLSQRALDLFESFNLLDYQQRSPPQY